MLQTITSLDLTTREMELFSEEWKAARESECRKLSTLVTKGLLTHEMILNTDEMFRDWMSHGKIQYKTSLDAQIVSLMIVWLDVAKQVFENVDVLEGDGFDVEHSGRFGKLLHDNEEILSPKLNPALMSDWTCLVQMARDGFEARKFGADHDEWWEQCPSMKLLRVLRYKNMEEAGIKGEELVQFADLNQYPATLLSELREPIVMRKAKNAVSTLE